jgi:hypothetical protein
LRVARVDWKSNARLDGQILQSCDVVGIVTDAIQDGRANKSKARPTDLVLRIDRVLKMRGNMSPTFKAGGTDFGLTLVSAGELELDQPFLCSKEGLLTMTNASHCSQIKRCSQTIARQMKTWLAGKLK